MSFKQWYENQSFQSFCLTCFTQGLQNITGRSTAFTVAILELFLGAAGERIIIECILVNTLPWNHSKMCINLSHSYSSFSF